MTRSKKKWRTKNKSPKSTPFYLFKGWVQRKSLWCVPVAKPWTI